MSQAVLSRSIAAPAGPGFDDLIVAPHHRADAPPLPLTAARSRNEAIDILRLVAAFSIVLVHSIESKPLEGFANFWRFPVPFYLFASLYFQATTFRSKPDRPTIPYVRKRFIRLYVPFLIWSAIYIVARNIKDILQHAPVVVLTPQLLWKGTDYHLWFLPFLLVFSIGLALIQSVVLRIEPRLRWPLIAAFIVGGFCFALSPMPTTWNQTFGPLPDSYGDNPTYAFVQWWRALPAACAAVAFALYFSGGATIPRISKSLGIFGLLLALGCCLYQAMFAPQMVARALAGLGCILLTLAPWDTTSPLRAGFARVGRLGYGIYLNHVLCVEGIHFIAHKAEFPVSPYLDVFTFSLSAAASIFIAYRISKVRQLTWLNG